MINCTLSVSFFVVLSLYQHQSTLPPSPFLDFGTWAGVENYNDGRLALVWKVGKWSRGMVEVTGRRESSSSGHHQSTVSIEGRCTGYVL